MANDQFQRAPGKGNMAYFGLDVVNPVDRKPPNRVPYLLNVTPNTTRTGLTARPGTTYIDTIDSSGAVHSIKRVNDAVPEATRGWARFVGVGSRLYSGQGNGSFNIADGGYSGNPLSLVTYRPRMSPEAWLYVYDSAQQRKYKTDGSTKANVGIAIPQAPPRVSMPWPLYTTVWDADTTGGIWSAQGDIAAPTTVQRIPAGTSILWMLYDTISLAPVDLRWDASEASLWAQHFAFGYKHPPMTGWLFALWFAVFPRADWAEHLLYLTIVVATLAIAWRLLERDP